MGEEVRLWRTSSPKPPPMGAAVTLSQGGDAVSGIAFLIWLLGMLPLMALIIWAQVRLSLRESRWPGLILPGLALAFGMMIVWGELGNPTGMVTYSGGPGAPEAAMTIASVVALSNIPTLILMIIYGCVRRWKGRGD